MKPNEAQVPKTASTKYQKLLLPSESVPIEPRFKMSDFTERINMFTTWDENIFGAYGQFHAFMTTVQGLSVW